MSEAIEKFRAAQTALATAQREAESLRAGAIQELLAQKKAINKELQQLGYYPETHSVEVAPSEVRKIVRPSREGVGGKSFASSTCSICGGLAGHDGRAHKSQGKERKPFTDSELTAKGLPGRALPEGTGSVNVFKRVRATETTSSPSWRAELKAAQARNGRKG